MLLCCIHCQEKSVAPTPPRQGFQPEAFTKTPPRASRPYVRFRVDSRTTSSVGSKRRVAGNHEVRVIAEALHTAGLEPLELAAKEGLALINGTDGMLGMLLLAIDDARHLFKMADLTAALAIEAVRVPPPLITTSVNPAAAQAARGATVSAVPG